MSNKIRLTYHPDRKGFPALERLPNHGLRDDPDEVLAGEAYALRRDHDVLGLVLRGVQQQDARLRALHPQQVLLGVVHLQVVDDGEPAGQRGLVRSPRSTGSQFSLSSNAR